MSVTKTKRPPPFFVADHHALDFLNSVAAPWGDEIEWISDGHDLLAWLEYSGLMSAEALMYFRKKVALNSIDKVAIQACKLRQWFRTFVSAHAGRPLKTSTLEELNSLNLLLAQDDAYRQIEVRTSEDQKPGDRNLALHWRQNRHWHAPEDLLLPIAQAMGDLICRGDFELVKNCEGPTCTLWTYDVSKNHTRRWCSMAVCGNRAKAAAHRARKRHAKA